MDWHAETRIPPVVDTIGVVWSRAFGASDGWMSHRMYAKGRREGTRERWRWKERKTGKGKTGKGDARFIKAATDHFEGEDGALRSGRVVASVENVGARRLAPMLVTWAAILCGDEPVADEW